MGLIREPKNVDLSTQSEPWSEQELADFRKIMQDLKARNTKLIGNAVLPMKNLSIPEKRLPTDITRKNS